MPKNPDPVAISESAVQAATAELQAAESAIAALRERETAAGLAADHARLACETAESARAEAIRAAITAGTDPAAEARLRAAREAVDAAEIGLLLARLPEQIAEARAALPAVLRAWRTHCAVAGLPLHEPAAFWRFVNEELALSLGGIEAAARAA